MELHEIARHNAGMFGEYVFDVVNDAGHWAMHKVLDTCQRVVVRVPPGVGATTLLVGRMLHAIGRDPSVYARIAYVTSTSNQGRKIESVVKDHLQTKEFKTVFGDIDTSQWPVGRPVEYLTPGSNILHARFDLVVMDNILDPASTQEHLDDWFRTLSTRVGHCGRVWAVGQGGVIDDFYHCLVWRHGFDDLRIPVQQWPRQFPTARIYGLSSAHGREAAERLFSCKTLVPDRALIGDYPSTFEELKRLNQMLVHGVMSPLVGPQPTKDRASLILDPKEYRSLTDWAMVAPLEKSRWEKDIVSTNHFGERVWLTPAYDNKGQRIGITDCCLEEEPCAKHAAPKTYSVPSTLDVPNPSAATAKEVCAALNREAATKGFNVRYTVLGDCEDLPDQLRFSMDTIRLDTSTAASCPTNQEPPQSSPPTSLPDVTCAITDTGLLACGSEGGAGVLGTNVLHDVTCPGCEPYAVRMIRHEAVPYIDAMLRADARGFPTFADARRATVLAVMESFRKPRPVMFLLRYVAVLIAAMHVHEHFCCGTAPIRDCDRVKTPEMYFYRKARGHFRTTDTTEGINHISEQLLHNNPTNAYLVMVAVSSSIDGADIHYTKAMDMAQMHLDYLARVNTGAASKPSTTV